jgi:hypothetical protein
MSCFNALKEYSLIHRTQDADVGHAYTGALLVTSRFSRYMHQD